jgi:bifunctional non-homologous end joining protein LigD
LVERPPEGDDWIAEVKYDGYRVVLALEDGSARAFTRSHADWSERFPTLTSAAQALPATSAILDGEAVVFDEAGISRFELLQRAIAEHPERIAFAAFDLLYLNGHDLRSLRLEQRKSCSGSCSAVRRRRCAMPEHVVARRGLLRQACAISRVSSASEPAVAMSRREKEWSSQVPPDAGVCGRRLH